jgi:hypothetical protein
VSLVGDLSRGCHGARQARRERQVSCYQNLLFALRKSLAFCVSGSLIEWSGNNGRYKNSRTGS